MLLMKEFWRNFIYIKCVCSSGGSMSLGEGCTSHSQGSKYSWTSWTLSIWSSPCH